MQRQTLLPQLNELVGNGQPACAPPLAEMWELWQTTTRLVDPFLDTLTTPQLQETRFTDNGQTDFTAGSLLQRVIYHYWYHAGKKQAIRQLLGHSDLPEFVGDIDSEAPYLPH